MNQLHASPRELGPVPPGLPKELISAERLSSVVQALGCPSGALVRWLKVIWGLNVISFCFPPSPAFFPQGLGVPRKVRAQHHQGWHQMRWAVKVKPALPLLAFPTQHYPSRDEPIHGRWAKPVGGSGVVRGSVDPAESPCTLFLVFLLQSEPGITCTRPDASLSSVALSRPCMTPTGRRWVVRIFPFCLLRAMVSLKPGASAGQRCLHPWFFHGSLLPRAAPDHGKVSERRERMKPLTL